MTETTSRLAMARQILQTYTIQLANAVVLHPVSLIQGSRTKWQDWMDIQLFQVLARNVAEISIKVKPRKGESVDDDEEEGAKKESSYPQFGALQRARSAVEHVGATLTHDVSNVVGAARSMIPGVRGNDGDINDDFNAAATTKPEGSKKASRASTRTEFDDELSQATRLHKA